MPTIQEPQQYMLEALKEAQVAADLGEVPIGAVVVNRDGDIIGRGHNIRESSAEVIGHAEIAAIREAAAKLGTWRLDDCDLFVTLEPCFMCASAIQQSRIRKVFYGAKEPKAGAVDSLASFYKDFPQNHSVLWENDLLGETCSTMLKVFFRQLRERNRKQNKALGGRAHRAEAARDQILGKPGDKNKSPL